MEIGVFPRDSASASRRAGAALFPGASSSIVSRCTCGVLLLSDSASISRCDGSSLSDTAASIVRDAPPFKSAKEGSNMVPLATSFARKITTARMDLIPEFDDDDQLPAFFSTITLSLRISTPPLVGTEVYHGLCKKKDAPAAAILCEYVKALIKVKADVTDKIFLRSALRRVDPQTLTDFTPMLSRSWVNLVANSLPAVVASDDELFQA